MQSLSRRRFLASGAAAGTFAALPSVVMPRRASAAETGRPPLDLAATSRTLDIDGRAATVLGLENGAGRQGLVLDPGQPFRVRLQNRLASPTIIHWHGQIPPNAQDGVPDAPLPALAPGELRDYDFEPLPGTHWMHSHIPVQEMQLLAAPLIVRAAAQAGEDRQDVVLFLHDFSFRSPEEVLEDISQGMGSGAMAGMAQGSSNMTAMDHGAMSGMRSQHGMSPMTGMVMDLNDFDFDAYLANDRTLGDPEVVRVENGGRVRLRVINAAAATVFWIDSGDLEGRLVAVDGRDVVPVSGRRFGLAMGQRLDILLDLPRGEGAFPVLALREGARERTGLILATGGAQVTRIESLADRPAPAFDLDLSQESRLQATRPLAARTADRAETVTLAGSMRPYGWTINGRRWGDHVPLTARSGQRIEILLHNASTMGHPMHLHGHEFQVLAIGGRSLAGALRDTLYVPAMASVRVALDAGEAAGWMLHCHHMPHLAAGMMTELAVKS